MRSHKFIDTQPMRSARIAEKLKAKRLRDPWVFDAGPNDLFPYVIVIRFSVAKSGHFLIFSFSRENTGEKERENENEK